MIEQRILLRHRFAHYRKKVMGLVVVGAAVSVEAMSIVNGLGRVKRTE